MRSRKKAIIFTSAAIVGGGYIGYRVYRSEYCGEKYRKWRDFLRAVSHLSDAFISTSEVSATVAADLRNFIHGEGGEVPKSVRQILKLVQSPEFQQAVATSSGSFVRGLYLGSVSASPSSSILDAGAVTAPNPNKVPGSSRSKRHAPNLDPWAKLPERLLDKVFSDAGKGFASAVVGEAVRSLVTTSMEQYRLAQQQQQGLSDGPLGIQSPGFGAPNARSRPCGGVEPGGQPQGQSQGQLQGGVWGESHWEVLLDLANSERGRGLLTACISAFASSAVSTFLESTREVNVCEDMLASMTSPANRQPVKELLTSVCGGAVESFVRTSHEVLTQDAGGAGATAPCAWEQVQVQEQEQEQEACHPSARRNLLETSFGGSIGGSDREGMGMGMGSSPPASAEAPAKELVEDSDDEGIAPPDFQRVQPLLPSLRREAAEGALTGAAAGGALAGAEGAPAGAGVDGDGALAGAAAAGGALSGAAVDGALAGAAAVEAGAETGAGAGHRGGTGGPGAAFSRSHAASKASPGGRPPAHAAESDFDPVGGRRWQTPAAPRHGGGPSAAAAARRGKRPLGAGAAASWQGELGQMLAVPETRKLVLEVAGAMSAQGVRAFMAICVQMLRSTGGGQALQEELGKEVEEHARARGARRPGGAAGRSTAMSLISYLVPGMGDDGVLSTTSRVVKAMAAKAGVATSVCFAVALHSLGKAGSTMPLLLTAGAGAH